MTRFFRHPHQQKLVVADAYGSLDVMEYVKKGERIPDNIDKEFIVFHI